MIPASRPPIDPRGVPASWRTILFLLVAVLTVATLILTSIDKLKYAAIAQSAQGHIQPLRLLTTLGLTDWVLAVAAALALLVLAIAEWRNRALTALLANASPAQSVAALTILLAWLGHSYLTPGVLLGGDTGTHVVRFMEVRRALLNGEFPHWTNDQYLGSPLLGFTGPLTYIIGGALDVLVRDGPTTAKLLLFSLHIAGGWACYALLQRLGASRPAAFVATLGFAGAFAHLHLFLYRGVFPQAFTILFLLLLFHGAEGLMRRVGSRAGNFLIFALVTAGLILNHQPHALFAALYLGLFGALSLALGRWQLRNAPALILAGICGAAMSVYAVLPLLWEADWVMIEPEGALFAFRLPSLHRLGQLVFWRNTRTTWGIDYWAYLGLPLLALAVLGAWRGANRALVLATLPCLALGLFLFNPVVRDVMFLLLFLAILAAIGAQALPARLLPLAALLLLTDVSSTSIQPVARLDKDFLIVAGQYLERIAPGERIVEIAFDRDGNFSTNIGPNAGPISYRAAVPRVAGHHNMAATRVHNYAAAILKRAEADLRATGTLAAGTRTLLGILGVSRVICFSPTAMGCPASFADAREDGPLGRVIPIAPEPALFAPRLAPLDPPRDTDKPMLWDEHFAAAEPRTDRAQAVLDDWLRRAATAPGSQAAATLPVRTLQRWPDGMRDRATPRLLRHDTTLQTHRFTVESNAPTFVQLAVPLFPGNRVSINGTEATPITGTLNLVVLSLDAGTSVIEIAPFTTPIRAASLWLTLAAVLGTALVAALLRRRETAA